MSSPLVWPPNLRMTCIVLDAEHVDVVSETIRCTKNEQAVALLASWRRTVDQFPFLVFAGPLHRKNGGVVGGLAGDWDQAIVLCRLAFERLNELAAQSPDGFTSAWLLFLTDERRTRVEALVAQLQAVEGSA